MKKEGEGYHGICDRAASDLFGGHAVSSGASVSAPAVSDPAHREHLSQLQSQKTV